MHAIKFCRISGLCYLIGYQHIRMYHVCSTDTNPVRLIISFVLRSATFSSPLKVTDYDGISKNVTSVGFCESGKWMYTGGEDGTARIWDLRSVIL